MKIRMKTADELRQTDPPEVIAAYTQVGVALGQEYDVKGREKIGPYEFYRTTCGKKICVDDVVLIENRLSQLVREVLVTGPDDDRDMKTMLPKIQETMLHSIKSDVEISDEAWLAIPQWIRTGMVGSTLLRFVAGVDSDA